MGYCEDAPCCGCCGPQVWAAEALASQERAFDAYRGLDEDGQYYDDEPSCEDGCGTGRIRGEYSGMGVHVVVVENTCDGCGGDEDHEGAHYWDVDVMYLRPDGALSYQLRSPVWPHRKLG